MRPLLWLVPLCLACRSGPHPAGRAAAAADSTRLDQAPVVTGPTVVAFRLAGADTLEAGDGASLLSDFRDYTALVAQDLADEDIALVATTADSVIVRREDGGPARVIMLSGLDYPFGYVLVEPGYAEVILTGVQTDDELLDQVDSYFGTGDTGTDTDPPVQQVRRLSAAPPPPAGPARRG